MIKRLILLAFVSLGVLLVLPPTAKAQTPSMVREEFHQTYTLSPNGRISLENIQGAVHIQGWDRNEVKVDAVKTAYSQQQLSEAEIKIEATADSLRIHTEYPDGNLTFNNDEYRRYQNPASVEYTLSVPRGVRLNSIELVNGSLDVEGLTGDVNASCVNGKLTVKNLSGDVKLGTVNGGLDATFVSLNESKAVSLGSVNGSLSVTIPSDSNAVVKAGTVHGGINNDFGLPVRQGDYVGRELYGQIGRGGARIKLGNVNGSVNIRRASDGRGLSPATSLLSINEDGKGKSKAKSKGDMDIDVDIDWDDDEHDQEREAQRAARDAQREAARAQREVQRAKTEAQRAEAEAKLAIAQAEREAQRANAQAVRDATREATAAGRAVQAESARAAREAQRAVAQASREIARAARAQAGAAAQVYIDGNYRLVERDNYRFDVNESPRVTVDTFDGTVAVHGWDKPEVVVNVVKRARDEQSMRGIRFNAVKDGNQVRIVADFDKAFATRLAQGVTSINASVNLDIFVPRKVMLRAVSGDGHLALDGINGEVDLNTADGSIDVVDGYGRVLAKTGDGRIRIAKFDGTAEASTGDGRISLEGKFAQLTARTGDGSILLSVPAGFNAIVETDAEDVVNESDFAVAVEPGSTKRLRRWKIGTGGALLTLRTGDGRIILRRSTQ